jgi:hypothetical protein
MITQEELKEILHYDSETGLFYWLVSFSNRVRIGDIAGYKMTSGYIKIQIKNEYHMAHRLAILYVDGYMPEGMVDHKDRIRHHNWNSNLRPDTTHSCNARNISNPSNNTSGVKGVCPDGNKWYAYIYVNNKRYDLGRFADFDEAVAYRLAAEQCFGWHNCDTNSPAYLYMKGIGE